VHSIIFLKPKPCFGYKPKPVSLNRIRPERFWGIH